MAGFQLKGTPTLLCGIQLASGRPVRKNIFTTLTMKGATPTHFTVRQNGHPVSLIHTALHRQPLLLRQRKGEPLFFEPVIFGERHHGLTDRVWFIHCSTCREATKQKIRRMIRRTEKVAAIVAGTGHMKWPIVDRVRAGNPITRRGRKWTIVPFHIPTIVNKAAPFATSS